MSSRELQVLEERLLGISTRSSRSALDELIDDDFREFGASGRTWTKQELLEELPAQPRVGDFRIADFETRDLGGDCTLATYVLTLTAGSQSRSLRSSIWKREGNRWRLVFHQGTPCP